MKIKIVCVGKIKEKYLVDAIKEYTKRISGYSAIEIVEVPDEKTPDKASDAINEQIKTKEGTRILDKLQNDDYVILLDLGGKMFDSVQVSEKLSSLMVEGNSSFAFVIGGSLGVSQEVRNRANLRWSFSALTFPHQLMRVMVLEQIYRAFKIMNHEPYHK